MFSLFIQLYTSCSIAESISSSRNNHLRSITYFYLRKPAHDCTDRSLSILFFWFCGNVFNKMLQYSDSNTLIVLMTGKVVSVYNIGYNIWRKIRSDD